MGERRMTSHEIPLSFWKEWEEADCLEKTEKVKHLVKTIEKMFESMNRILNDNECEISEEQSLGMKAQLLNGYFEDLYTYAKYEEDIKGD